MKNTNGINSISRSANILTCLSNGVNTITEIAESCKYTPSTVHRLLKALELAHFVIQDPNNRKYYLGPLVNNLVSNLRTANEEIVICAVDEMKRLADLFGETVRLGVRVGIQYILLHEIPSTYSLSVYQGGRRGLTLFSGAEGKILLSKMQKNEVESILRNVTIERLTKNTVTDKEILMDQLEQIRRDGYAITHGENVIGSTGIATFIENYVSPAVLSVLGSEYTVDERQTEIITELKTSAALISSRLAGR